MILKNELVLKTMKTIAILMILMGGVINVEASQPPRPGEPCVVKGTGERGTYVATTKTESTTVTYGNERGSSYESNSNSRVEASANVKSGAFGASAGASYNSGSKNTSSYGTSATTSKTTSESWQSVRCEPNAPQAHNAEAATPVPNGYRW